MSSRGFLHPTWKLRPSGSACLYFDLTFEREHNSSLENVSIHKSEGTALVLGAGGHVAAEESSASWAGVCLCSVRKVTGPFLSPCWHLLGLFGRDVTFLDSGNFPWIPLIPSFLVFRAVRCWSWEHPVFPIFALLPGWSQLHFLSFAFLSFAVKILFSWDVFVLGMSPFS